MAEKERYKNSISMRLMIYFFSIILIPLVVMSLVMQTSYKNSLFELATENAKDSLKLINYDMDKQFADYDNLTYFISRDRQLQEIGLEKDIDGYNQDVEKSERIFRLLNYYRTSMDQVLRVVISYENGLQYSSDQKELKWTQTNGQQWYRNCINDPERAMVLYYKAGTQIYDGIDPVNTDIITVSRAMRDKTDQVIGVVSIAMYSQILESSMSNILSRNGSSVYLLNENGSTIYSPIVGEDLHLSQEKDYIRVEAFNERTQWTIVGIVPMSKYLQQINTISRILAIVLLFSTAVMGLVSAQVGSSIVRPIKTLCHLMKQAEKGDLSVRFKEKGPVEISELGESFNVMIQQLDQNVKQVYLEQKAKRKAEMEALQANIKPHFLYNTLDTIHWMAKSYHATDIVETVDALSTLFRVTLSKGSETITVAQEIQHVSSYLQIQKVRYEEMLSYDILAAQDCLNLEVQKLILQPLVENAIYHGIKESGREGRITIRIWKDEDKIFLSVEDDGIGMSQEKLEEVRYVMDHFDPAKKVAYGVVNVHQRIVLNYGKPYGLYLESEYMGGTTALICHPVI